MRFQFLKEHQKKYNIKKACKILKVSRSGYYDYLNRRKSDRAIENEALTEMIKKYNLAELKYVAGETKPSYVITEDEISKTCAICAKNRAELILQPKTIDNKISISN